MQACKHDPASQPASHACPPASRTTHPPCTLRARRTPRCRCTARGARGGRCGARWLPGRKSTPQEPRSPSGRRCRRSACEVGADGVGRGGQRAAVSKWGVAIRPASRLHKHCGWLAEGFSCHGRYRLLEQAADLPQCISQPARQPRPGSHAQAATPSQPRAASQLAHLPPSCQAMKGLMYVRQRLQRMILPPIALTTGTSPPPCAMGCTTAPYGRCHRDLSACRASSRRRAGRCGRVAGRGQRQVPANSTCSCPIPYKEREESETSTSAALAPS